jgi:hypothetical protein
MANEAAQIDAQSSEAQLDECDLLEQIIDDSNMVREESQKSWASEFFGEFAKWILIANVIVVLMVTYIPFVSMFIPSLFR